jgi:hypothetical protein
MHVTYSVEKILRPGRRRIFHLIKIKEAEILSISREGCMNRMHVRQEQRRIHELTMHCVRGKGEKVEAVAGPEIVSAVSVYAVKLGRRKDVLNDYISDVYKGIF